MSGGNGFDDSVLGRATGVDAPPPAPSVELLRAVEGSKPVRTRTRFGAALLVSLVGLVAPAIALVHGPLRRDLAGLPVAWVIAAARSIPGVCGVFRSSWSEGTTRTP